MEALKLGEQVEIIKPTGGCRLGAVYEVVEFRDDLVWIKPTTDDWLIPAWGTGKFRGDDGWKPMGFHHTSLRRVGSERDVLNELNELQDEMDQVNADMRVAMRIYDRSPDGSSEKRAAVHTMTVINASKRLLERAMSQLVDQL